jgi:hypothetical protein
MNNTTRLILMLDREFDKTVESIANKKALMERTGDFRMIAELASEAAELEDYLEILFGMAQEILGV